MAHLYPFAEDEKSNPADTGKQRDINTQLALSIALGLAAFLTFCALRPRWTSLYAARKRQKNAASNLPELPDSFFGWIPVLYRISEEEVLASAGLDAFVFLSFFRMAIKFLAVTFFFSLVVIYPIHRHYIGTTGMPGMVPPSNDTELYMTLQYIFEEGDGRKEKKPMPLKPSETDFYWMYVIFVYFFSGLALYLIIQETKKVIRNRQDYLGSQATVTDRTIRLSGIPPELRSEQLIKETIENLNIGKVEAVTLCKDWEELDSLLEERTVVLRKLETAWTIYNGSGSKSRSLRANGHEEESQLLDGDEEDQAHVSHGGEERPTTRVWYGILNLQSRKVDAIDHYEEKLRKLDEKVQSAKRKEYMPTPLAFVTLDSTASAQMAVQAIIDPKPMVLLASLSPAPSDLIWQNTYLSRSNRMFRAWSITIIIGLLTIFWSALLVPLAGLLSLGAIREVLPQLADALESNELTETFMTSVLPTLLVALLNVAVPYLYYWFATLQGMSSRGDVEMSCISKNYFFVFFNFFLIFTVFGTIAKAKDLSDAFDQIGQNFKDVRSIAFLLAQSLQDLLSFYVNYIILQALGLFPFRLLMFGSVAMYPISTFSAKTPRDYAEIVQPPVFSYGFYLPQTILIFVICIVYSVLPYSWLVLFFGLVYFLVGSFVYKYQLLYAMDHSQHSTGRAWSIICNRIVVGLIVFQLAMIGVLALKSAIIRSILLVPLLVGTIWFLFFYQRTYEPLMRFIAIRSLTREPPYGAVPPGESRYDSETARGRAVDEDEETGLRFINPNLVNDLEGLWLSKRRRAEGGEEDREGGDERNQRLSDTQ